MSEISFKDKNKSIFENNPKLTLISFIISTLVFTDLLFTKTYKYYQSKAKDRNEKIYVEHDIYHHGLQANSKAELSFGGRNYTIYTNSLGLRDKANKNISLDTSAHRIIFMGDSFTEGIALNYEDTFVGIIDSALSESGIDILNAGRSGYSPIIYWRKLKYLYEDLNLRFDEVVVAIDISDAFNEFSYYNLTEDLRVKRKKANKSDINILPIDNFTKLKTFIINNSSIAYIFLNSIYDFFNSNPWEPQIDEGFQLDKWTFNDISYEEYGKEGVALMIRYMDKLYEFCKVNNINLSVMVYPWPSQIWYEDLNSRQVKIWKNWALGKNIKVFNLFPYFVKSNITELEKLKILNKYYLTSDCHFNKNGNRILANEFLKNY